MKRLKELVGLLLPTPIQRLASTKRVARKLAQPKDVIWAQLTKIYVKRETFHTESLKISSGTTARSKLYRFSEVTFETLDNVFKSGQKKQQHFDSANESTLASSNPQRIGNIRHVVWLNNDKEKL